MAAHQYGVDTNWYMDSGATDHITSDLEKLTVRERYTGGDQIHTANGSGMSIDHIGYATISTPDRNLHIKDVLHVPEATKDLISASKLALENNTIVEIHPHFFLIKDLETRKVLLRGRDRKGLYPVKHVGTNVKKQVLSVTKPSSDWWHRRFGHPSSILGSKIISKRNSRVLVVMTINLYVTPVKKAKVTSYLILNL